MEPEDKAGGVDADTHYVNGDAAATNVSNATGSLDESTNTAESDTSEDKPRQDDDARVNSADDSPAIAPLPFKPGAFVQWESNGILQMPAAKRLSHFSDDCGFAFVEGSTTGIPVAELIADAPYVNGVGTVMQGKGVEGSPEGDEGSEVGANHSDNSHDINGVGSRGNFTPQSESEKLERKLRELDELELVSKGTEWGRKVLEGGTFTARYRCYVGAVVWEKKRRNAEAHAKGEQTMNLQDFCDVIGVNRKSASGWAENWQAVRDAAKNLTEAAIREEIDLFKPSVAGALAVINAELAGRLPDADEIPALLLRLELPPNPAKPDHRPKPGRKIVKTHVPITPDLRKYCKKPESIEEIKRESPQFFSSFVNTLSLPASEVFRPLMITYALKHPEDERSDIYRSISEAAADLAVLELKPTSKPTLRQEFGEGNAVMPPPVVEPIPPSASASLQ